MSAHAWYEPGYTVSKECNKDGIGCDGTDCDCYCHFDTAPVFDTNDDVADYHKE